MKGKGGQSALELCSAGNGGESASGAVKGECFESALEFGGGVVAVCFCFGGGRGPVSFRAVKGKGGQSALELCSAGNGGESASGAVKGEAGPVSFGVVLFCGEWRRVSFRGL